MKTNTDKNHPQTLDEFLDQIREEAYCKSELGSRFCEHRTDLIRISHVQP